jgi:hypothetical protein
VSWGSRAPAGFRVGAGHGALIEYSLTRGGVAVQAPQASLWAPLTQPKTQAGLAVACSHAGSGPPWWRIFLLYNEVAPGNPGRPASSPARAPSVNKHIHPAAVSL